MHNNFNVLWYVGEVYLALSVGVIMYWAFELCRTCVAMAAASRLKHALVKTDCAKPNLPGRESLGQLLNDLDNLVRDHGTLPIPDLNHYVIGLSLAHMLREYEHLSHLVREYEHIDPSLFEKAAVHLGTTQLNNIKNQERTIISTRAVRELLENHFSWFVCYCLAARLVQNWNQIYTDFGRNKTQPV